MATWQHLRSSTANKRPTTSLADGRIAINTNTASPGLFFKDSAGTGLVKVGPVHVGTTAPNAVPAAGGSSGNYTGEQWLDTSVSPAQMKVWNGSTWVGIVADELPVSKLQDGAARQLIQTDAAGTGVEWTSNIDVPGTLDVTSTATFDSIAQYPAGSAAAPTITFTGDTNTGLFSPGSDQLALATGGIQRLLVDSAGRVGVGTASGAERLFVDGDIGFSFQDYRIWTQFDNSYRQGIRVGSSTRELSLFSTTNDSGGIITFYTRAGAGSSATDYGSERMRLDSSGRLGLGTSSPSAKAEIVSSGSESTLILRNSSAAGSTYSELKFAPFTGTTAASASIRAEYYTNNASSLAFRTTNIASEPVTRLFIDGGGNVGIGTNGPSSLLHLAAASGTVQMQFNNGGTSSYIGHDSAYTGLDIAAGGGIRFRYFSGAAFAEGGRFDTSGRLLVGTSTAYDTSTTLQVKAYAASAGPLMGVLDLQANYSSTIADQQIGWIRFLDANGAYRAQIACVADGTSSSSSDAPGRLVFSTTADGASSPTERMRIASDGFTNLFVTANDGFQSRNSAAAGTTYGFFVGRHSAANTGDGTISYVVYTNGNVQNTNNSYGAISDIKLKENIVDANSQWNDLKALQVRNYNFKEGQTHTQIGLVAQEVELVSPGLVTESPDRDEEGNDLGTVTKSVNYSVLYMKAVKALQEAMERIETLEAKVAALEAQ